MLEGGHDRWRAFLLHYDHAKSPSELTRRQTSVPSARRQEANTRLLEQSAAEYSNSQQADMTVAIRDACSRKNICGANARFLTHRGTQVLVFVAFLAQDFGKLCARFDFGSLIKASGLKMALWVVTTTCGSGISKGILACEKLR